MKSMIKIIWPIITFLLYLISGVLWIVFPEYPLLTKIIFFNAITLTAVYGYLFRNEIYNFIKSHWLKTISYHLVQIFLVLSIVSICNYLFFKNNISFDITAAQIHKLSEKSLKLTKNLEQDSRWILFSKKENWDRYSHLLNLYKNANSKIDLTFIDYIEDPTSAELYQVKNEGTLVILYNDKTYKTVVKDELSISKLIFQITNPQEITIGVVPSYSAIDYTNKASSFSYFKQLILESGYKWKELKSSLNDLESVQALFFLDHQFDFSPPEIEKIEKFITSGKFVFVTATPNFNRNRLENLYGLFNKYGLAIDQGIVLDRLAEAPSVPVVSAFNPEHLVTKNFKGNVLFPLSGNIQLIEENKWDILAASSPFPASWTENTYSEIEGGRANYDEKDFKGPSPLVGTYSGENAKIAFSASTGSLSNQMRTQSSNFNFFLNIIDWGVGKSKLISLDRPQMDKNLIYISSMEVTLIFYIGVLTIPFVFFFFGIFQYRRRLKG
mgnify:CR=1 FL=1